MNRFQNKLLPVIMTVLLLVSVLYVGREMASYVTSRNVNVGEEKRCVVIDAGHGGIEYRPKKFQISQELMKVWFW